jgi:hypothetical protein
VPGDWQLSSLGRVRPGYLIPATLGSDNSLDAGLPGGAIRPGLVSGARLINPDWTPENALLASYVNPKPFSWPEPGKNGNAARNHSSARHPWVHEPEHGGEPRHSICGKVLFLTCPQSGRNHASAAASLQRRHGIINP